MTKIFGKIKCVFSIIKYFINTKKTKILERCILENVAVVSITRVASRFTMQLAGVLLILLGMFTKVGAVMATIPDACVGGILAMGVCMIAGVSLSNLPVRKHRLRLSYARPVPIRPILSLSHATLDLSKSQ